MPLPPLATIDDVEERLAPNTIDPAEEPRIESLISYASALVRAFTGCEFDTDESGYELPAGVTDVVVGMVERSSTNPGGAVQQTAGPYSVSFGPDAAARVYLTAGDKLILSNVSCRGPLRSVRLTRGPVETPNPRDCRGVESDPLTEIAT